MASTTNRKVSPSLCVAGSREVRSQIKPALTPRTTSKTHTSMANRPEGASRLPTLQTSKVRFADNFSAPCAPDVLSTAATPTGELDLATNTEILLPSSSLKLCEVKPEDNPEVPDRVHTDSKASVGATCDPFADPVTFDVELAGVSENSEQNPFTDDEHVSDSASSISSDLSSLSSTSYDAGPSVTIVSPDSAEHTPNFDDLDLKETHSYFTSLEQSYHPDVARRHYQAKNGTLWNLAEIILGDRHLSPLDLTEVEFVDLVLSQGNATSDWLSLNTRCLTHRLINRRIETRRYLTRCGLSPCRMTEDLLDKFCYMSDNDKEDFLESCNRAVDIVTRTEKIMDMNDTVLRKASTLSLFDKAALYSRMRAEVLALDAVESELAAIEATMKHCFDDENIQNCKSTTYFEDGRPCKEIAEIFDVSEHAGRTKKYSTMEHSTSELDLAKLKKLPAVSASSGAAHEFETDNHEIGADTEGLHEQSGTPHAAHLLFDEAPRSRLARLKLFLSQRLGHPLHRSRNKISQEEAISKPDVVDSGAEADSDNSIQSSATAPAAGPAGSDNVTASRSKKLLSQALHEEQNITTKNSEPRSRRDSLVKIRSSFKKSISEDANSVLVMKESVIQGSQDAEFKSMDIRLIDDVFVDIPERQLENAQESVKQDALHHIPSCFSLKRRNAFKIAADGTVVGNKTGQGEATSESRTIRKKISQVFGTRKTKRRASKSDLSRNSLGRKIFGRKGLPDWDLSE